MLSEPCDILPRLNDQASAALVRTPAGHSDYQEDRCTVWTCIHEPCVECPIPPGPYSVSI